MEHDPSTSRRERRIANRRILILEAAARLFAEKGFHRTTTRDIAEAADVSEGTLYNYFENKDELLMGIMAHLAESQHIDDRFAGEVSGDAREFLRAVLRERRETIEQSGYMLQSVLSEILVNPELRERYYEGLMLPNSADPIVDKMSIQPKLAKLPMLKNIVVEGGYVDHVNANQSDYAKFLRFHCCENVDVRSITSTRNMTGSIEFYHSANVVVRNCHLAGSKKADLIYAVVAGAVNGHAGDKQSVRGLSARLHDGRQLHATVARIHTVNNGTALTCTANGTTNVLTTNANHEFQVNDVIRFSKKEGLPAPRAAAAAPRFHRCSSRARTIRCLSPVAPPAPVAPIPVPVSRGAWIAGSAGDSACPRGRHVSRT